MVHLERESIESRPLQYTLNTFTILTKFNAFAAPKVACVTVLGGRFGQINGEDGYAIISSSCKRTKQEHNACDMREEAKTIDLSSLRATIERLQSGSGERHSSASISLGASEVDNQLPWHGLARNGLHEINGDHASFGFHAGLLRRAAGPEGHILWCRHAKVEHETGLPYGPGLARFGLRPEQFLFVRTHDPIDVLWAMEEGLRTSGLAAVVGDGTLPDFTATRRLQLAAEAMNTPALILPPPRKASSASVALTRWDVTAGMGGGRKNIMRWQVNLMRCRGGSPKNWIMEWDEQALRFHMAEVLADRTTAPDQRQSA